MTTSAESPPPFARVAGALITLAALLAMMVASASPASAHARLESSSPQDGSTLAAVPPEIMLQFNEPIEKGLNQVSVTSGSTNVAKGEPQVEGNTVYQPVEYTMKPGEYTVTYKVVSADGHPVSGSFSFTYAPPGDDTGAAKDPEATPFSPSETSPPAEEPENSGTPTSSPDASSSSSPDTSSSPDESSSSPESSSTSSSTTGDAAEETAGEAPQDDENAAEGDEAADESTSPWWWAAAVAALAIVLGGVALLVRGRRDAEDEDFFGKE